MGGGDGAGKVEDGDDDGQIKFFFTTFVSYSTSKQVTTTNL